MSPGLQIINGPYMFQSSLYPTRTSTGREGTLFINRDNHSAIVMPSCIRYKSMREPVGRCGRTRRKSIPRIRQTIQTMIKSRPPMRSTPFDNKRTIEIPYSSPCPAHARLHNHSRLTYLLIGTQKVKWHDQGNSSAVAVNAYGCPIGKNSLSSQPLPKTS